MYDNFNFIKLTARTGNIELSYKYIYKYNLPKFAFNKLNFILNIILIKTCNYNRKVVNET